MSTWPTRYGPHHFARVVESSDDAIVSKDLNGIILSWNRAAERIFGYSAAEAIGQSIKIIIPEDRHSEEDAVLAAIRAGRTVSHFETVRQRKGGALVDISLTVSPIFDDEGTVLGASKIARDVTETRRLREFANQQAALTAQLHRVAELVASSLDRSDIAQHVTDAATELTGAEFGAFFYNVIDQDSRQEYMLYTLSGAPKEAFAAFPPPRATAVFGPTFRGEGVVRLADVTQDARYGRSAPYFGMPPGHLPVRSYLAVPVRDRTGGVLGGLFFGHSQVNVFAEHHEQLAVGVAAWATLALENARLYEEAQEASRTKDEFLAVLSHELRTPLNAIVGYTKLLRGGVLEEMKATQALETIDRNATWLTQIIEDVLDVSRIVAGKLRLDVQPVDLSLTVQNAIATVQPAADAKGVRLQAVLDSVGPVSGDRDRLQQSFWNVLANAVKFTPRGGRVQVQLARVNSHVELTVADIGIGIAAEFLPRVFERFRQADSGTTRRTGGLGLGLSIVKHLIELHGGTVTAASAGVNQGSTFRIRLPLMIVHPMPRSQERQHPRAAQLTPLRNLTRLDGIKVLAIDDEADALTLVGSVVEAAGARATLLSSPHRALEQLLQVRPDVVLLDLGMPEMDGFEVIAKIRAQPDPHVRDVPAIALTAFARSEDRTKALEAGFQMHLAKPVDPGELAAAIRALVRRS